MNFMSVLSIVVSALCTFWLIGLGIFVIVKKIQIKRKAKKEIEVIQDEQKAE